MEPRIMIMAGGTGGHVFPALAVAAELRARGAEVFWLGTRQGMEARIVPAQGLEMEWIDVQGLRSTGLQRWLAAPVKLLRAMWQARGVIRRRRPTAVLGMGGFVSGPGGVVSRLLGLPLVIHEQNALAGMTNRWLARIATRVMAAFPGALPNATVCGNPVRADILALPAPQERFADRSGPLRVLVLGGSQGAKAINEVLPGFLRALPEALRPEVWHQAGRGDIEAAQQRYLDAGIGVRLEAFIEDMQAAYAWADLVLCRAGALTIAELTAAGIGAVLVPYPHAVDDHQTVNAHFLVKAGAGLLLPQTELSESTLEDTLMPFLKDRAKALEMAIACRSLAQPEAASNVADACLEAIR